MRLATPINRAGLTSKLLLLMRATCGATECGVVNFGRYYYYDRQEPGSCRNRVRHLILMRQPRRLVSRGCSDRRRRYNDRYVILDPNKPSSLARRTSFIMPCICFGETNEFRSLSTPPPPNRHRLVTRSILDNTKTAERRRKTTRSEQRLFYYVERESIRGRVCMMRSVFSFTYN